ncbi:MAG: hypothetical protein AB1593_08985 [Pseudomonadota bacterium]
MSELSIPAVEPALIRTLETRPKQAAAWLARLPFASPADAAQQIRTALHAMNRSTLDSALRETLLALYRPAVARTTAGLETLLGDAGVPPHAQQRQHAALLRELALEHAIGYKHLLRDPAQGSSVRHQAELLARLLAALRIVQDAHALTYSPLPAGLWLNLHRLYAQARSTGLADAAIGDTRPASLAYREALLIALADPPHMSRGELLHTRAYAHAFGTHAVLREGAAGETGFAIDTGSDKGPAGHSAADAGTLWLDTDALCRQLHDTALRLRTGDTPRRLGLPEGMEGELSLLVAKRLSKRWRNGAQRAFSRRRSGDGTVEVVAGVCAIHRLLSDDPSDEADGDSLPIGDVSTLNTPPLAVHASRWTMRNDSAAGLALSGVPDSALNLKVGDALALREGEGTAWSLAVIRWIVMRDGGEVELGIERLAPRMQPVWVRPLRGHRKTPEPALFVPGLAALKQPDRLMLPRFLYADGMDAEIWQAARQYILSFGRRLEHTPSFDLIDFTVFA